MNSGILLIIRYQLTKFDTSFQDIFSFWPFKRGIMPQREIIQTKTYSSAIFDGDSIDEISKPIIT